MDANNAPNIEIFSKRLKSARVMNKLSLDDLCLRIGGLVSKQTISKYERALTMPSGSILLALAEALNLDIDYFFRPYIFDPKDITVSFRKKRSISTKEESSIKEKIFDRIERYLEIEGILDILVPFEANISLDTIHTTTDMINRAKEVRKIWELGNAPIANVQTLLEYHNIRVIAIKDAPEGFDGLSGIINDKYPVIVVNSERTAERQRFTTLHELGHILYNKCMDVTLSEHAKENLCHIFASEMLIGSEMIDITFGKNRKEISLAELFPLQQDFGISIDALVIKAHQRGLLSEYRFRGFFIRKNQDRNFKDLVESSRFQESPTHRFQSLVFRAVAQELISDNKAASLLNLPISDIRQGLNLV